MTPLVRRFVFVAAIGAALFTATACADVPQDPPPTSASPTKAAQADKKASCDAFLALDKQMEDKAGPLALKFANAEQDPAAALSALIELKTLVAEYETKLAPIAANAGDAQVKSALDAELFTTRKVKADLEAAGTDPVKLEAVITAADNSANDNLKTMCGANK